MLNWIKEAVGNITGWMGEGIGAIFEWLLGGLATIVTKVVDAAGGFWNVLDATWDFAVGFIVSILNLFSAFFPFVPAPVSAVIGMGLMAVLLAGIVNKVRGK